MKHAGRAGLCRKHWHHDWFNSIRWLFGPSGQTRFLAFRYIAHRANGLCARPGLQRTSEALLPGDSAAHGRLGREINDCACGIHRSGADL
jgi:hypothetical protein